MIQYSEPLFVDVLRIARIIPQHFDLGKVSSDATGKIPL